MAYGFLIALLQTSDRRHPTKTIFKISSALQYCSYSGERCPGKLSVNTSVIKVISILSAFAPFTSQMFFQIFSVIW